MTTDYIHSVDQFDAIKSEKAEGLEKEAQRLLNRQAELQGASEADFALVLWTGSERLPKFPCGTARDIAESHAALEKSAAALPDELVKTARYHLELAGREHLGKSLYGEIEGQYLTNVVYTGEINQRAYQAKQEGLRKEAKAEPLVIAGQYAVSEPWHVKMAEKLLERRALGLAPRDEYEACRSLVKKATDLGVEIESNYVRRYERSRMPASLGEKIAERRRMAPQQVKELYDRFEKSARSQRINLLDAADCLLAIDQLAGFTPIHPGEKLANSRIQDTAYDVIFPVRPERVEEQDLTKAAAVFGQEFIQEYRAKGKPALDRLSAQERRLFASLAE
jgi:hypothetical protein